MTEGRLGGLLRETLRRQRELHQLTQRQLAERTGVSQGAIARIEAGTRTPSPAMVDRLLAALGVQLTVGVEPLDADIDAAIAGLAGAPLAERIAETDIDNVVNHLAGIPYVFDGPTAALLQGAPVPADAVDIALAWDDAEAFTEWLTRNYGQRWHAKWQQFGYLRLDPREPGDPRVARLLDRYRLTRERWAPPGPS